MSNRSALPDLRCLVLLCCLLLAARAGHAQCNSTVSTFPYVEDFETNDGGWTTGGNFSDWVWGTPGKRVITGASSGSKCWITGGLANAVYNNDENSYLMSPCFDFSGLTQPYLNFRLFWETERKFDGASLEYSIDGGGTWQVLGSSADNASCPGNNWFNTQNVTTLGMDGWSGNVQPTAPCPGGSGGGSGAWVTAGRALSALAGEPVVRFRFRFAAGSRCNEYDGFAVDDIWIGNLQPLGAEFTFSCSSERTASFSPVTMGCGSTYTWNFGDPASGSSNTATGATAAHTFSAPGDYLVRMTATGSNGAIATATRNVRILGLSSVLLTPVRCNGGNEGRVQVVVNPAGSYNYSWSTTPEQTGAIGTGLPSGTYQVRVTGNGACAATASVLVNEPPAIVLDVLKEDARCGGANGKALIRSGGGTLPHSYSWSPVSSSTTSNESLLPGNYSVTVTDAQGCTAPADFTIGNIDDLSVSLGADTVLCAGETLRLEPGTFATYRWQDGSTASSYVVTQSGTYSVRVTSAEGCTAEDRVTVTVDCSDVYFPTAFTPNNDGRNDAFGPVGNVAALRDYQLKIYGRWGQLLFESNNPFRRWDGRLSGDPGGSQVYVWIAQYRLPRLGLVTRKGSFVLMR
ncbi:PKD domain-containing protein [Flaviaesturariibacter amylovorans]|uniref:PKD domain-containing protein n=1 Tax=Flaviaesturariibacter amylovorans TaxID=1084520 RepID=A0ABP8GTW5_9BACT